MLKYIIKKLNKADEENKNINDEMISALLKFSMEPVSDCDGEALEFIISNKDILVDDLDGLRTDIELGFVDKDSEVVFDHGDVNMLIGDDTKFNNVAVIDAAFDWLCLMWRLSEHDVDMFENILNKL